MSKFSVEKASRYIYENASSVNEEYKGEYHFSAPVGWINDPNGFICYKGKYHLFYQYHPYSAEWGPMHWGHAVSDDLIKWVHLPVALAPDRIYDKHGCWSGSAVAVGGRLYLMYTGINVFGVKSQCLAYSDNGVDFIKYEKNPVLKLNLFKDKNELRDPFVWRNNGTFYALAAYEKCAKFYSSPDLKSWKYIGRTVDEICENVFECPCLMNISGKDVLIGSPVRYPQNGDEFANYSSDVYSVGKLGYRNGEFLSDCIYEIDRGMDFYAAQCARGEGGKAVMIAWMNMWERKNITSDLSHGWSGMMTLPRELETVNEKLIQHPAAAIKNYYKNKVTISEAFSGQKEFHGVSGRTLSLKLDCDMRNAVDFSIKLLANNENYAEISYNKNNEKLTFDTSHALYSTRKNKDESAVRTVSYKLLNNRLKMQVFVDKSSVEAFIGDGEITASMLCFNDVNADRIIFNANDTVDLHIEKNNIEV